MNIAYIILLIVLTAIVAVLVYMLSVNKKREKELLRREQELLAEKEVEKQRSENFASALHAKDIDLTRAESQIEKLVEKAEQDKEELEKLQASFRLEFRNLAQDILEEKSKQFKETNKESLDQLLNPFKTSMAEFRKRIEDIYSDENQQRGALKAELNNLRDLNRMITDQTSNLTEALRGNSKIQGDWGEMILDTILEGSNLKKNIHYFTQSSLKDAEGNDLRPDVIVKLPDEKNIVIDSKVSLTAYVNYIEADDEAHRRKFMDEHIRSVRNHVNELGKKSYQDNVLNSPDFVIMFVPAEPAFLAALGNDNEIWNDAYRKKVIISSPTNLFGILKIVDDLWKRDDLSRNANRIAKEGAMMYDKFVGFVKTLESVGKNIESAQTSYDRAMNQLNTGKGNLVSRAQKMRDLNVSVSKSLPESILEDADDLELD